MASRSGRLCNGVDRYRPARMSLLPFGEPLRDLLTANLAAHERVEVPLHGRRHAAVAIVVVDSDEVLHGEDPLPPDLERMLVVPGPIEGLDGSVAGTAGGPAFLLTRRAPKLRAHGGQWALPGGRIDERETPARAAMREVAEELALTLPASSMLGALDDYETRSGYVITPLVFWGGADPAMSPTRPRCSRSTGSRSASSTAPTRPASCRSLNRTARWCRCRSGET